MAIVQSGSVNTTALVVPELLVQIVPPQNIVINGVPTNVVGVVGTASWGPVDKPSIVSSPATYQQAFGPVMNRTYDMGTAVNIACQQGASSFRCVRVTDGTDTAATIEVESTCISFTALYTGSQGNNVQVTLSAGSQPNSTRAVVAMPGNQPELFDNIGAGPIVATTAVCTASVTQTVASTAGLVVGQAVFGTGLSGSPTVATIVDATHFTYSATQTVASGTVLTFQLTGNALWVAMAAAINTGVGQLRGQSQTITATAGAGTTAPTYAVYSLTGGTDGVTTITSAVMIGVDTIPRTGMYALRSQGCSVAMLADLSDSTQWTVQSAFGLSEGIYMIAVAPSGSAITNGTTGSVDLKNIAGLSSYAVKLMHGDWLYWNDQYNGIVRLVSPQGFVAGLLGNLSPQNSSLNKQLVGVIGSQKSGQPGSPLFQTYADADLAVLFQAGVDVISNPQPGGSYWGVRGGLNTSNNAAINGDNYTRMTNYIASTLNAGMGLFIGMLITPAVLNQIQATLSSFLQNLLQQGLLNPTVSGGLPFSVICNATNNPFSRTSLGYAQADVSVQYTAILKNLIINLQGGQTVVIETSTAPAA
jgi:hypothetical protein